MAAFAMQYLPCLPPWVLDIPVVSAKVALDRLDVARGPDSTRALRAWAMIPTVAQVERDEALARAGVGSHQDGRQAPAARGKQE